jgi:hypothetical protein
VPYFILDAINLTIYVANFLETFSIHCFSSLEQDLVVGSQQNKIKFNLYNVY